MIPCLIIACAVLSLAGCTRTIVIEVERETGDGKGCRHAAFVSVTTMGAGHYEIDFDRVRE